MTYTETLAAARKEGAGQCTDAGAMALFCEHTIQYLAGAVSGRLAWEGAQARGMTFPELAGLCSKDPVAVSDLQWVT